MRYVVMCLLLAWAACGPSTQEIAQAKMARYRGSPDELYLIALQTASKDYKIGAQDPGSYRFSTSPQWYSREGGRQSAGAGDVAIVNDRSVNLSLVVQLVPDGDRFLVTVTPKTLEYMTGSSQPRELKPDDPNLPPWIPGRVDSLSLAIHDAAKGMETH